MEVLVQHLHKVVDTLEVVEVVVTHVHADAEVEAGVPPVDDLEVAELNEVCVFLVANRYN